MAQIRNDLIVNKRIFSEYTEKSAVVNDNSYNEETDTRTTTQRMLPTPKANSPKRRREDEISLGGKENKPVRFHAHRDSLLGIVRKNSSLRDLLQQTSMPDQSFTQFPSVVVANMSHIPASYPLASQYEYPSIHVQAASQRQSRSDRVRSPNLTYLAPPTSNFRPDIDQDMNGNPNEDLNRFVSSSTNATATTGTTLTGSFIKHPGPLVNPQKLVQIKPADVPGLSDRVGKMVFDRADMRWVKERGDGGRLGNEHGRHNTPSFGPDEAESEDPFRDIESLTADSASRSRAQNHAIDEEDVDIPDRQEAGEADMVLTDQESEDTCSIIDETERDVSTFSFSDPASGVVQVMTGDEYGMDETSDSDDAIEADFGQRDVYGDEDMDENDQLVNATASMSLGEDMYYAAPELTSLRNGSMADHFSRRSQPSLQQTPVPSEKRGIQPPRSALKSGSATPVTARKPGQKHRRSVSFSDGRRDGKILGLESANRTGRSNVTFTTPVIQVNGSTAILEESRVTVPSVRSKRIANMLDGLEEPSESALHSSSSRD